MLEDAFEHVKRKGNARDELDEQEGVQSNHGPDDNEDDVSPRRSFLDKQSTQLLYQRGPTTKTQSGTACFSRPTQLANSPPSPPPLNPPPSLQHPSPHILSRPARYPSAASCSQSLPSSVGQAACVGPAVPWPLQDTQQRSSGSVQAGRLFPATPARLHSYYSPRLYPKSLPPHFSSLARSAHAAAMAVNKANSRGDSVSPTEDKPKANSNTSKAACESVIMPPMPGQNGTHPPAFPSWKGPAQDRSVVLHSDPFEKGVGSKLSGGATTFKPTGSKPTGLTAMALLNRHSTIDALDHPVIVSSDAAGMGVGGTNQPALQPIGTRWPNFSPTQPRETFTTDIGPDVNIPGSHYVKLGPVAGSQMNDGLKTLYEAYDWVFKVHGIVAPPPANGSKSTNVFICFNDLRHAKEAFEQIQVVNPNWSGTYISQTEYASVKKSCDNGTQEVSTSFHDGQVILVLSFAGRSTEFKLDGLYDQVRNFAKTFGEVVAFSELDSEGITWKFRAEFYMISIAKEVLANVTKSTPSQLGVWKVHSEALPDFSNQAAPYAGHDVSQVTATPHKSKNGLIVAQFTSPTGRTAWSVDDTGTPIAAQPLKVLPKCQAIVAGTPVATPTHRRSAPDQRAHSISIDQRSDSWPGAASKGRDSASPQTPFTPMMRDYSGFDSMICVEPQVISLARLAAGQDVRTTVMVRNLPNEMTYKQMKAILDRICPGEYDFIYIRVDFANAKNVGYGFVNFINANAIRKFYEGVVGQPWLPDFWPQSKNGKYLAQRIAELSYATMQGSDCLCEKFRNSSVMDENPDYRPKVFWSLADKDVDMSRLGEEKTFPAPNNASKHQRSRDNAGQVGLYASGSRRNRGHGDRHRRSQFDRGTSAQIREEAYYNNNNNNNNNPYYSMPPQVFHDGYAYPGYAVTPPMPIGPPTPYTPVMINNGNGFVHTAPAVMGPHGYGPIPFTDPFHSSYVQGQHTPTPHQRGGRQSKMPGRPLRNIDTSGRAFADARSHDPFNRGGPVQSPAGTYYGGNLPRVLETDETDEYGSANGSYTNGGYPGPNGYHHDYYGQS